MQTIYFNLIKQGLIDFVQAIHDRAVQSDTGIISGFTRNSKLSDTKKRKINALIRELHDLKHEGTDAELKDSLEKLIHGYYNDLLKTCMLAFDKNEGVTEKAMFSIFGLLTTTYLSIKRMGLEDIEMESIKGDVPISVLAFFCSRYKLEHMVQRAMAQCGFSESISGHPKLSRQKEDLFIEGFAKCRRIINGFKEELEDYEARVRDAALHTILSLRSQLTTLCREATIGTKTSIISLNFLGAVDVKSGYVPDEGTMKKYLIAAETMIKQNTALNNESDSKRISTDIKSLV